MADSNGPDIRLPGADGLANFLDGAEAAPVVQEELNDAPLKDVEVGDEPDPQGDVFDRKYVEKLRRENASYRERAKRYADAFDGYEDGAVDEWKSLISGFKADPVSTAQQMAALAESVLTQYGLLEDDEQQEVLDDANKMLDPGEKPLTRAELEQFFAEKQSEQQLESMVSDIENEAKGLGYDLNSREYKLLLMTAQEIPSGDLKEAHNILMADRQRAIDEYVAEKSKGAGRTVPANNIVGVPSNERGIKDFKDAKAALTQFLDANK